MNRSIRPHRTPPDAARIRLRCGISLLSAVLACQTVLSMATGTGPLPHWWTSHNAEKDIPHIQARTR